MRAFIRTLLIVPLAAILILGAGLYLYGALHWSWHVLAWVWLALIALVETATSLDYTHND